MQSAHSYEKYINSPRVPKSSMCYSCCELYGILISWEPHIHNVDWMDGLPSTQYIFGGGKFPIGHVPYRHVHWGYCNTCTKESTLFLRIYISLPYLHIAIFFYSGERLFAKHLKRKFNFVR